MSEELQRLEREWQAQTASEVSKRTFAEFRAVRLAVWEMCEGNNIFVGKLTPTSFERVLGKYPTPIAVHTLRLVHLIASGRPTLIDVERMAERMQARGITACRRAAYEWPKNRKADNTSALSTREWIDAVEASYKIVGNPDQPRVEPAALLTEHASPEPCAKSEQQRQRAEELMAAGVEPAKAWCKAAMELVNATPIVNRSMPARKRRALA